MRARYRRKRCTPSRTRRRQRHLRPEGNAPVCALPRPRLHNLPSTCACTILPRLPLRAAPGGAPRSTTSVRVEALGERPSPMRSNRGAGAQWAASACAIFALVNKHRRRRMSPAYIERLRDYYRRPRRLCETAKDRLGSRNPLAASAHAGVETCPRGGGAFSTDTFATTAVTWGKLLHLLEHPTPDVSRPRLVRAGRVRYTRRVIRDSALDVGGPSTIVGGGRYDGLITELGGSAVVVGRSQGIRGGATRIATSSASDARTWTTFTAYHVRPTWAKRPHRRPGAGRPSAKAGRRQPQRAHGSARPDAQANCMKYLTHLGGRQN